MLNPKLTAALYERTGSVTNGDVDTKNLGPTKFLPKEKENGERSKSVFPKFTVQVSNAGVELVMNKKNEVKPTIGRWKTVLVVLILQPVPTTLMGVVMLRSVLPTFRMRNCSTATFPIRATVLEMAS